MRRRGARADIFRGRKNASVPFPGRELGGLYERGTDATQAAARVRAASGEADGCGRRRHVESVAEREVGSGPFSAAFFGKSGRCVDEAEGRAAVRPVRQSSRERAGWVFVGF